jgi:hypothetical protein
MLERGAQAGDEPLPELIRRNGSASLCSINSRTAPAIFIISSLCGFPKRDRLQAFLRDKGHRNGRLLSRAAPRSRVHAGPWPSRRRFFARGGRCARFACATHVSRTERWPAAIRGEPDPGVLSGLAEIGRAAPFFSARCDSCLPNSER